MRANPEPGENVSLAQGQDAVGVCHASRPESANWLELQGGMVASFAEQLELFISTIAKAFRKLIVAVQKMKQSFCGRRSLPGLFPSCLGLSKALLEGDGFAFGDLAPDLLDQRHPSAARRKVLDHLFVPVVEFEFIEPRDQGVPLLEWQTRQ